MFFYRFESLISILFCAEVAREIQRNKMASRERDETFFDATAFRRTFFLPPFLVTRKLIFSTLPLMVLKKMLRFFQATFAVALNFFQFFMRSSNFLPFLFGGNSIDDFRESGFLFT